MIRSRQRAGLALAVLAGLAQPEGRFKSGLTATVVSAPAVSGHPCVNVTLRWPVRVGAKTYLARVAPTRDGAWTALPSSSACGTSRTLAPTAAIDPQPQTPPPNTRRLFYRVIAIGPAGPIDSTDVVPVEIAPAPAARQP
jgi:hypothetical protein